MICYSSIRNKCMKDYDENKESSYLTHWDMNNLHGWVMSQKLPVDGFELIESKPQFNRDLRKNYHEDQNI